MYARRSFRVWRHLTETGRHVCRVNFHESRLMRGLVSDGLSDVVAFLYKHVVAAVTS